MKNRNIVSNVTVVIVTNLDNDIWDIEHFSDNVDVVIWGRDIINKWINEYPIEYITSINYNEPIPTIDKDGTQLFSNEENCVHIEGIQMNDDFYDDIRDFQTEFSTNISKQAVIRYTFTRVKGAHTINVLWISPTNKISGWSESILIKPETIWFGLDFSSLTDISSGIWSVHLFVDGEFILKNDFSVKYVPSAPSSLNMSV